MKGPLLNEFDMRGFYQHDFSFNELIVYLHTDSVQREKGADDKKTFMSIGVCECLNWLIDMNAYINKVNGLEIGLLLLLL